MNEKQCINSEEHFLVNLQERRTFLDLDAGVSSTLMFTFIIRVLF